MDLRVFDTYDEMSVAAGQVFADQITEKADSVLGLATGSTPLGLYADMVRRNQAGEINFEKVRTFNLDEYYPIHPSHDQSYRFFMNKNLFTQININMANTHVPNGDGTDCEAYDAAIVAAGGVDLQLLGVGHNGHIGFNEPAATLVAPTHVTTLTKRTLEANARFFASIDKVPTGAVTMGMGTIMKAKKIICLISGADKHPVVEALLNDTVDPMCPATFLKMHPNVIIMCDKEAYEG